MSKISTYSTVTPAAGDKVIGTDVAGTPANATKNFRVEDIAALAGTQGLVNLSQVLSAGNTATDDINLTGNFIGTGATISGNISATGSLSANTITTTGLVSTGSVLLGTAGGANIGCNALISAAGGIVVPSGQQAQFQSGSQIDAVLPSFPDNAGAVAAGLPVGRIYRTNGTGAAPLNVAGIVMVRV